MKKRYITGIIVLFAVVFFVITSTPVFEKKHDGDNASKYPRIGQRLWTYNMNKREWREYSKNDSDTSKEEIILMSRESEEGGGFSSYALLTGNAQVPKEAVWVGESSDEFLVGKHLYSYFPKQFMYYEVVFNGVKFVPRVLNEEEIAELFKGYNIIRVSELKKGTYAVPYSKSKNKYIVLNDVGDSFYKYYIIPNDSDKLQIEEFSDKFRISGKTDVRIQRIEGCTKAYPCYDISFE